MNSNPKIDFTLSPESGKKKTAEDAKFRRFIAEVVKLNDKYGYDAFLIAISDENSETKLSAGVSTQDTEVASGLLAHAFSIVQQLIRTQMPNAPGGMA